MEAVLAEALLSQCPDAEALLRAVGGGEGEGAALSAERAEALRFLLERAEGAGAEKLAEAAVARCLPALLGDEASAPPPRLVRASCGLLRRCVSLGGGPLAAKVATEALEAAAAAGRRRRVSPADVEALSSVASRLEEPELLKQTVEAALRLLWDQDQEEPALLVAGRLLPALGRNHGDAAAAALGAVWDGLMAPSPPLEEPWRLNRTLLALSALSDALFSPAEGDGGGEGAPRLDARRRSGFWKAVQKGLTARDGLCRKRARYLLKRALDASEKGPGGGCRSGQEGEEGNGPCLFWWCTEKNDQLTQFWGNYILIMEILEGNQIHVIKPVLPKLNSLYEHALSEKKDCWVFHPSWHMCIYKRMFESENKTLAKEGVVHFLEIWQTKCLPTSPGFSEFVIGPLMDALSESFLYSRLPGQTVGTCPPLGMKLQAFLATFFTSLPAEEKGTFLLKFIQKMSNRHWCAVPILFFSMALAHIPPYRALDVGGLLSLRDVLQCTMITHQILLRGAAQCYLLQAAILLTDIEKVSLSDISNFIVCLRPEESLGRGTILWRKLCDWLCINDMHFRKALNFSVPQDKTLLSVHVQFLVEDYLKTPTASSEDCLMPDWSDAKLVATMIFLAADVEDIKHRTEWIELKPLLNPLLDVLLKLGTNPYISSQKSDKSLQLLLKLLQTCSRKWSSPQTDGITTLLQKSLMSATESILHFLLRRLTAHELNTISDLQRCDLYLGVLLEITSFSSMKDWKNGSSVGSFISSLINASLSNLQETSYEEEVKLGKQIQKVVSLASLSTVCEIIDQTPDLQFEFLPSVDALKTVISCTQLSCVLKKPSCMEKSSSLEETASYQGWGKIVARFIHDQWVCLNFVLNNQNISKDQNLEQFFLDEQKYPRTLHSALEAITVLPSDHVLPVFRCMKILVPKVNNLNLVWFFGLIQTGQNKAALKMNRAILSVGGECCGGLSVTAKTYKLKLIGEGMECFCSLQGEFMLKSKIHYYVNSLQHRIKNRLWQTLLVLFPKLHEDILARIVDRILQAGHSNNQASVKYLIEWSIVLILHKFPQFLQNFWDCFNYGEDQLKTSICTFLAVLSHFDTVLQNTSEKIPALKKALVVVLQWCFHHNFSVRLYALIALKKIWGMCKASFVNDFEALAPVIECSLNQAESMHGSGNAKKNWQRIQKHFFFENFHPLKDYCLETIFYTLPRLSDIAEEEWIPISKFKAFTDLPLSSTFPCSHSCTTLLDLKPSDWCQQDRGLNSSESCNERKWTDVQKKIIPWKDSMSDLDLELVFQDRTTKLGKSNSKLIVVASLLDKPTNLGGLCRTCEIFGVSALIVGSLHYTNDKQFQYLSVSAEQWLSLIEVKPFQLVDYLEQKKIEGYTIIGVEQTAKSCDLTEYCFPEKSLLLLGNEHEGIPANLIQQLDTCVEIPQQGVIRSLNVHVSGALLIWEYTRQQIVKEKKSR
ncbi:probable methyltransferase TARBP1 [Sceloporus undulatus]|uniref:probable methyltransferase TARBP1 n=1 Tax=Sceloporus undulatus TaxID=8520 RepID=UPI001C4C13D7|nr:probable methyltransferase TARBP1 [Sceloporus undulatus]